MTLKSQYDGPKLKVTLWQVAGGYHTGRAKLAKAPQSARIAAR